MSQRGSVAVEFALVLPLLLIGLVALAQVVIVARDAIVVSHAAREGAREAAVTSDDAKVEHAATRDGLDPDRTRVEVRRGGAVGEPVVVVVHYEVPVVAPLSGWLLPDAIALTRKATMRQEEAAHASATR